MFVYMYVHMYLPGERTSMLETGTIQNGVHFLPLEEEMTNSVQIIKEGLLEKKGHSHAFLLWPK